MPTPVATLCDSMDRSLPASSVHGIFQARMLKWVAMPTFRESSQPRAQTWVSCVPSLEGEFFITEPLGVFHKLRQTTLFPLDLFPPVPPGFTQGYSAVMSQAGHRVSQLPQRLPDTLRREGLKGQAAAAGGGTWLRESALSQLAAAAEIMLYLPGPCQNASRISPQTLRGPLCNKRRGSKFRLPPWVQ